MSRSLDSSGRRRDHAERPELNHGTVEYIAPADYMVKAHTHTAHAHARARMHSRRRRVHRPRRLYG